MEEDHDWERVGVGVGIGGDEEAEPEFASGVHGDVIGFDAFDGFGNGTRCEVEEGDETTVEGAVWALS